MEGVRGFRDVLKTGGSLLLLFSQTLILACLGYHIDAEIAQSNPRAPVEAPLVSPVLRWSLSDSRFAPDFSGSFQLMKAVPSQQGHRKHLSEHLSELGSQGRMPSPAQPPSYPSSSRDMLDPSMRKESSAMSPDIRQLPSLEAAAPGFNNDSISPSSAQQPVPHTTGCCKPNMVQKRGTVDCHCVYPITLELYLLNVSLSKNWRDKFLEELASQLGLRVSQFEIDNFYVVGTAGLNITMDITPHTEIGFSANEAHKVNYSLSAHVVRIDPTLVGGYKLLNLTWFQPPPSSPAPTSAAMPSASSPFMLPSSKPAKADNNVKHPNLIVILGTSIGGVIIITALILALCCCAFGQDKKATTQETVKTRTLDAVSIEGSLTHPSSTRFLAFEELKVATNNFESSSVLGEGGFGQVFKGVLSDGTAVAIKKLSTGGHQGNKEFLVEVEMLSRLHHRNLVKLVGYYSSRDSSQNLLCYELVPNGSLEAWLHGPLGANCPLDWDTRMKIALDAARGLAYLHEDSQPCVIHRDFKASNILLENNFHAKVADFGLAKQAPEGRANYLSTRVMGTFGYVAPEYAMTGHLLVKSDVYSYGVVLLELLTGKRPVDMSQPSGQENLVTWARPILREKERLDDLADPRLARKYPKDDFILVCTIAAACVSPEASQRPTMGEVVQSLKMVQRATEYHDSTSTNITTRPNIRESSTAYESDGVSSMFSSGPFSGLSLLDNENISRTAIFSEDLHEGR